MNLWELHEPRWQWDERQWTLVWAWGADDAREIAQAAAEYPLDSPANWSCRIVPRRELRDTAPKHDAPHREQRWPVMRLAGWMQEDDDDQCEACGLWGMGIVGVCQDCCCCDECGCKCEEDSK